MSELEDGQACPVVSVLMPDAETATRVGARHGRPVIFVVDAGRLHAAGHMLYGSANGVWLTDHVPTDYLRRL